MNKTDLDQLLFSLTENEKKYKAYHSTSSPRYAATKKISISEQEVMYFQLDNLNSNKFILRKDSRYIELPFYTYSNINMNYIYSGECHYWIDNKELTLHKGDVCIFDKGVIRAKERTGDQDIIININISDEHFQNSIPKLSDQNIITKFLLNCLLEDSNHDNYIVFRTNEHPKIIDLFDRLLIEYYENRLYSKEIIQNYLSIIIMELLLLYQTSQNIHSVHLSGNANNQMLEILYYIENHYTHCTLKDVAAHFGYHEKYLCSYIKKNMGKTFQEIKRGYRLDAAARYLSNSTLTIHEIAVKTGYTNYNQFYKEFQKRYQMLPSEFRKKEHVLVGNK